MKKLLSMMAGLLLTAISVYSQAPAIFNYQGVARNSVGNALINKTITLRLTIHDATAGGAVVYQESRTATTNPFGLFNVQVGSPGATNVTGTIPGVNWGLNAKFIQVEIDPNGGSTFINIGTAQIASVPYAFYSAVSNDLVLPFNKTQADNGTLFKITNSGNASGSTALEGLTNSTAANAFAIIGTVTSGAPGANSTGVRGINNGTGANGIGVWGSQNGGGWGVYGTAISGIGVNGNATTGTGVNGAATSGIGVNGSSTSGDGVHGASTSAFGVSGVTSASNGAGVLGDGTGTGISAGVLGRSGEGAYPPIAFNSGVLGRANVNVGVQGLALSGIGVRGESGSGAGVYGTSNTGRGGFFEVTNPASVSDAVRAETNGTGASWGIRAISSGTNGAGLFQQTNLTNTANNLQSNQGGLGRAGLFNSTNAANTANAVEINVAGTGFGLRVASTNGAPRALQTAGGVQLTGINEALNRVLTSDAVGNATWQNLGAIGGVTGSGTVNFVPKWTPVGTNLGNSQIFDNGTNVGINTAAPTYKLHVVHGGGDGILNRGTGGFSVNDVDASNGDAALRFLSAGAFRWNIRNDPAGNDLQIFDMGAGLARMRILTANGNVGIATATPAYRLEVDASVGAGGNGMRVRNTASFATIDVMGVANDQAIRFGKAGVVYSGINTLPDGDHISFFKFGFPTLMNLNVNTGNLGVGGVGINAVAKVHVRGFNAANNLYSSSTGFLGATGVGSNDIAAVAGNEKWGVHTFINGSDLVQHAIFAEPGTTAIVNTGLFGRVSTAPTGGTSSALYAFDAVNNGTTTWAATILGRMRYSDGTQGLNKILTSDAIGNASWQTASGAGIVSGSGTLNFVPKWTPNGTTLGNSIAFDNGSTFSIGSTTPTADIFYVSNSAFNTWINVDQVGANLGGLSFTRANAYKYDFELIANNDLRLFNYTAGNFPLSVLATNGNVGINQVNPIGKLHVVNTSGSTVPLSTIGVMGVSASGTTSAGSRYDVANPAGYFVANGGAGQGIYAIANGPYNSGGFSSPTAIAVQAVGITSGAGIAQQRTIQSVAGNGTEYNFGIRSYIEGTAGSGYNAAINGVDNMGVANSYAGYFDGKVLINDGTQAAGYVFTSTGASGLGSWQENTSLSVGISIRAFTGPVIVPSSTLTPLTQWAVIDNEDGGANYNSITGEYTITKSGVYQVNCQVAWAMFTAPASRVTLRPVINGSVYTQAFSDNDTDVTDSKINFAKRFTAGDIISFEVLQNSGFPQSITGFFSDNHLSIQFLHK